jgi:arabinogalactan oligomer/maltooligosaccharide transport system permease protein
MGSAAALARAQSEAESFLRPAPQAASPEPYIALGLALLLVLIVLVLRRARAEGWVAGARESKAAYAYLAPAFLGMSAVVVLPFIVGAAVSLFAHHDGQFTFVGLSNFVRILASSDHAIGDPMSVLLGSSAVM